MRMRSRWWVLSVLSLLGTATGAYAQHDPNAFTSLGTLNISSGTLTINTDTLAMSGAATFTGVALAQTGGPQIAVFDFTSINIGAGVLVNITGSRALSLLSRGNATIAANMTPTDSLSGYNGGTVFVQNTTDINGIYFVSQQGFGPGGGGAAAPGLPIAGGGGFGGKGGGIVSGINYGGLSYGNLFQVLQGGSGGGAAAFTEGTGTGSATGGRGAGALEVSVLGSISVASVTLNGNNGSVGGGGGGGGSSGGGAGGGILLYAPSGVSSTGTLSVNGGNGSGAGGAGGRVAIGGITSYTLGTTLSGFTTSLNGGTGSAGTGYAGTVTVDALSTTVPSGMSITLNGNPITSIAGSTTQTGATVEAYVRNDLTINSGATVTLGVDNPLRLGNPGATNPAHLTVDGTFNTNGYSQAVSWLRGSGVAEISNGSVLTITGLNPPPLPSNFTGTLIGDGIIRLPTASYSLNLSQSPASALRFELGSGTSLTFNQTSGIVTVGSSISGAGGFTQNGAGTTILSGINTYTGTTTVSLGTLKAGSTTAFGSNSAVTLNSGTMLDLNGFSVAIASLSSLSNTPIVLGSGVLTLGDNGIGTQFYGQLTPTTVHKVGSSTFQLGGALLSDVFVDGGGFSLSGSVLSTTNSVTIGPGGSFYIANSGISLGQVLGNGSNSFLQVLSSTTIGASGNLVNLQGRLDVGSNTLNIGSSFPAQLGIMTTMSGGTINATNGIAFGSGSNFSGSGTINAKVSAHLGSVINATGSLALGDSTTPAGFVSAGELRTNANTITLNSSSRATLGSLTTLGSGGSPGTVAATNGVLVDFGNSLVGYGTISTPNNLIQRSIINGTVQGNSGAQPITFTGWIKGAGTFTNVVFAGTWDPGFSPTLITAGSIGFSSTNNLIMELGGLTRGSQFDGIDATGNVDLAGALSITRINGFNPNTGDAFVLINRTGGAGTFTGLNEGDTFLGTDGAPYIISYQGMNYITNTMAPGANGFSIVIAAVPEPTTWALIGLSTTVAGWFGYRRYRQSSLKWEAIVGSPEDELA